MTDGIPNGGVAAVDGMLEPERIADAVVDGLAEERFPAPHGRGIRAGKAEDVERWLRGMRRLQARFGE